MELTVAYYILNLPDNISTMLYLQLKIFFLLRICWILCYFFFLSLFLSSVHWKWLEKNVSCANTKLVKTVKFDRWEWFVRYVSDGRLDWKNPNDENVYRFFLLNRPQMHKPADSMYVYVTLELDQVNGEIFTVNAHEKCMQCPVAMAFE